MIDHEKYTACKVVRLCSNIYCIGSICENKFIVDAVVIGGNYPTVSHLPYLDIYTGMGDKKEIAEFFEKLTLKYWDVINLVFEGFTSGQPRMYYCEDEDDDVNFEFPCTVGMYIITNKGDFAVPAPIWTKVVLGIISEYNTVTMVDMSPALRVQALHRDKRCLCCGKRVSDGETLEATYIIPIKDGGKQELDNLQTLCTKCSLGNIENKFDFLHN